MTDKQLTIDVWQAYREAITAIQYEVDSRNLYITLTGNGQPIDLTGASVQFFAVKPDGEIIYNDCVILDAVRGKILHTLTQQTCIVPGDLRCWIEAITDSDVLRTQEFKVIVLGSEDSSGAVESTSEFTALQEALGNVGEMNAHMSNTDIHVTPEEKEAWSSVWGPNLFMNGDSQVWGRGTSFSGLSYQYTADRWCATINSASTISPLYTNPYSGVNWANTVVANRLIQLVENSKRFSGKYTVSLRARINAAAGSTASLEVSFRDSVSPSNFTTIFDAPTVTLTSDYQTFNVTVDIPGITNNYLAVWVIARTAGVNIQIEWIKLEKGSTATAFIPRTYAEELAQCKRYFERITSGGVAPLYLANAFYHTSDGGTTGAIRWLIYYTEKRINPNISFGGTFAFRPGANAALTIDPVNQTAGSVIGPTVAFFTTNVGSYSQPANTPGVVRLNTVDSYIDIDAEIY